MWLTANEFKNARRRLGMTQKELGTRLDKNTQAIRNLESGRVPVSEKLADAVFELEQQRVGNE